MTIRGIRAPAARVVNAAAMTIGLAWATTRRPRAERARSSARSVGRWDGGRTGSQARRAGPTTSDSTVTEATPRAEKLPSSTTAGTSLTSSAAKPVTVVRPAIATGARRWRSVASLAALGETPATSHSSS